jgi:hypothetical protein
MENFLLLLFLYLEYFEIVSKRTKFNLSISSLEKSIILDTILYLLSIFNLNLVLKKFSFQSVNEKFGFSQLLSNNINSKKYKLSFFQIYLKIFLQFVLILYLEIFLLLLKIM